MSTGKTEKNGAHSQPPKAAEPIHVARVDVNTVKEASRRTSATIDRITNELSRNIAAKIAGSSK